ncbi:MAG: aminoacyl-tRNA deacylase [Candidatus Eiseniibacteriota bacterium]
MSVSPRLRELLDREGVRYQVVTHTPAFTAQETAHSLHLPGRELAKVVVIRHGGTLSLAVLPARSRVDLERLGAALRDPVALASEAEIAAAFPDCEMGAMPPFGSLYGLKTYVDESLTHDRHVVFNAGTHVEAIRMPFEDYRRVAAPIVLWFAESLAGTNH